MIRQHVKHSVGKAVRENNQVSTLSYLPVVGKTIESTLEQAVTDIVTASVINLLSDIKAENIETFVRQGLTGYDAEDQKLDKEMLSVVNECIEHLKRHVGQQRWKTHLTSRQQNPAEDIPDTKKPVE